MTDYSVARDFYGRPYVTQDGEPLRYEAGRKTPVNAEPYTRISTLAGTLEDKGGLIDWVAARSMMGVVKSEAIYAQLAHLLSAHSDPWAVKEAKKPLKELLKKAQELGGSDEAAGLGTAFHGLTETLDSGVTPEFIPPKLRPWLDAYEEAMQDWEPIHIEPFVVCDELKVAGSPDRYLRNRTTGKIVCADIKSGSSDPFYPMKVSIQVAIGANSVLYDQETGARTEIDCDIDMGLLIHVPIRSTDGRPRCDLYPLDLVEGWAGAELAADVRDFRGMKKLVKL